jgi:predicted site-specific integrase-resolvase
MQTQGLSPLTLSIGAAAERLGIPEKTVSKLIKSGELKTVVLPFQKRPKILGSSVEEAFARIYGQQQPD